MKTMNSFINLTTMGTVNKKYPFKVVSPNVGNPGSGIREIVAGGIWNSAQGIRNPLTIEI